MPIQSSYFVHFRINMLGKFMNTFIPTPAGISKEIPLLYFYNDGLGIE